MPVDNLQGELAEFLRLTDEKARVEQELKDVNGERARAEEALKRRFEEIGVAHVKTTDGRTVYLAREMYAGAKLGDRSAVTKALHAIGLSDLVSEGFNTLSLSAYIRELDRNEEDIPAELADVIDVRELYRVRVRGS